MYANGTGVPQDTHRAARLLKFADDQGYQLARDILGQLTAKDPAGTRVRVLVRVTGLSAAAHLNGRLGTAVTLPTPPTRHRPDRGADRRPTQERLALLAQPATCLARVA